MHVVAVCAYPLNISIDTHVDLSVGWLPPCDGDFLLHSAWYAGEALLSLSTSCIYVSCIYMCRTFLSQLFGTIRIASIDDPSSEINDYNNFSNFFRAFLVMIRYAAFIPHS